MTTSDCVPSFLEIYNAYVDFVWSTSKYHGVHPSEVDDVTQDVFFTVYRKYQLLERPESMRSWVYGIVRRTVQQYHRKRQNRPNHTNAEQLDPEQHGHISSLIFDPKPWERSDLLRCLRKLDPKKREVFALIELGARTPRQICDDSHVPQNTVYARLRAARLELRAAWRRNERNGSRAFAHE